MMSMNTMRLEAYRRQYCLSLNSLSKPELQGTELCTPRAMDEQRCRVFNTYNYSFHEQIWKGVKMKKHEEIVRQLWNRIPHLIVASGRKPS